MLYLKGLNRWDVTKVSVSLTVREKTSRIIYFVRKIEKAQLTQLKGYKTKVKKHFLGVTKFLWPSLFRKIYRVDPSLIFQQ